MNKYARLAAIFVAVLAADQLTKYLAVAHLTSAFDHDHAASLGDKLHSFAFDRHLDGDTGDPSVPDLRTPPVPVIQSFWHFKYVENPGAAWGLLGNLAPALRVPFFHVVSVAAIAFILFYYRKLRDDQHYLQVALALVLGGAVGNYLDRVVRSYVIDFIDWHWFQDPNLHWPTFNVADSAICVGVGMMLLENLFVKPQPATPVAPEPG
jgi:signal peptidase II